MPAKPSETVVCGVPLALEPMESEAVEALPSGRNWQFEPKYDGFRCLVFRHGPAVALQSRRQRPLQRYFPEIATAALELPVECFVLDGELIIPDQPFDTLQLRLHPAASRVARLSQEFPAQFIAFDLLARADGQATLGETFRERRAALDAFFRSIGRNQTFVLSKATRTRDMAMGWLDDVGHGLDGLVAKDLDSPYRPGERAMQKFKLWRTVDCVVGGVYYRSGTRQIEYLLMGLYDDAGQLNYVGRCGVGDDAADVERRVAPLLGSGGFTGKAPGGRSRWSVREREAVPMEPRLVAEVSADHVEHGRFRHGSRLLRWRDDKPPESCTMEQLTAPIARR